MATKHTQQSNLLLSPYSSNSYLVEVKTLVSFQLIIRPLGTKRPPLPNVEDIIKERIETISSVQRMNI